MILKIMGGAGRDLSDIHSPENFQALNYETVIARSASDAAI